MALSTQPKSQFVYDLLLASQGNTAPMVPVRLKLYIKDTKLYVDYILLDIKAMELAINGESFGQYIIDIDKLPDEITYEFDY